MVAEIWDRFEAIDLRALLTDVFLLGEVLRAMRAAASQTAGVLCSADTSL